MVELLLDTVDLIAIQEAQKVMTVSGLTSTPSIIKREGKIDFVPHMKESLELIGSQAKLHLQLIGRTSQQLIRDTHFTWENIGYSIYTKIPVTAAGLEAIRFLKTENPDCLITATAIYSPMQAYLAIDAKADYIAIYTDRSQTLGLDPFTTIREARYYIEKIGYSTKIMASSIKNVQQISLAIQAGADAVTFPPSLLETALQHATVLQAVNQFTEDWISLYGQEKLF